MCVCLFQLAWNKVCWERSQENSHKKASVLVLSWIGEVCSLFEEYGLLCVLGGLKLVAVSALATTAC